jgi:hypothetical protein
MVRSGWLAVGATVAGCGAHVQEYARANGATELSCPKYLTTPWNAGGGRYVVTGCGRQVVYQCQAGGRSDACSKQGEVSLAPLRAIRAGHNNLAAQIDLQIAEQAKKLLACAPGKDSIEIPLGHLFDHDVDVEDTKLSAEELACVKNVLDHAFGDEFPMYPERDSWRYLTLSYSVTSRVRPVANARSQPKKAATGPSEPLQPPAPTHVDERSDAQLAIENQVRNQLDANADKVLSCTMTTTTSVRAEYSRDGVLRVMLRGDAAGTPEERCIQDALGEIRVGSSAEGGIVVHLVSKGGD